jgi:hypothetical protein
MPFAVGAQLRAVYDYDVVAVEQSLGLQYPFIDKGFGHPAQNFLHFVEWQTNQYIVHRVAMWDAIDVEERLKQLHEKGREKFQTDLTAGAEHGTVHEHAQEDKR